VIHRLLVAVLATAGLLLPASATAADVTRVPYADDSGYPEAVRLAVRSWNRAGTKLRLVATDDPAKVVIPIDSQKSLSGGHAALGGLLGVQLSREKFDAFTLPQQASVIAHVIGHALRLPDIPRRQCAVMNPMLHTGVLNPACLPGDPGSGRFRCGAAHADGKVLAALYGGRAKRTTGYCRLAPGRLDAAFNGVTATLEGGHLKAIVRVTNTGALPADLGVLIGSTIVPVPGLLAPGATRTVTYPMCLQVAPARLYSATFDALLGAPLTVPVPGC
jgi:hypothetical protein